MTEHRPPTIDPVAAARWQQRPQTVSAWLHEEVARRMAQRLDWIVRQPASWLHWEPVRGGLQAQALLAQRYPGVPCELRADVPDERVLAGRAANGPWWQPRRWLAALRPRRPAGQVDLLWANMCLHLVADPMGLMRQWHEALADDGLLLFSCLGPDTLRELRTLYIELGWPPPAHEYTDMHDWGDMLLAAGFAEPVMDMERIELTFETPERLLRELRELGRNLHPGRFAGLRGRGWLARLHAALGRLAAPGEGGRLKLSFEVVYGHARKVPVRVPMQAETAVSLGQMRSFLTQHKKK